jgi:hypothetical protein
MGVLTRRTKSNYVDTICDKLRSLKFSEVVKIEEMIDEMAAKDHSE